MSFKSKKACVWIKDGKIVRECWVDDDVPTPVKAIDGAMLFIVSFDADGNWLQADLVGADGFTLTSSNNGVYAFGGYLDTEGEGEVIEVSPLRE